MPEGYHLLVFETPTAFEHVTHLAEARRLKATLVPTPAGIDAACAECLRFNTGHKMDMLDFMEMLYVPARLYHVGEGDERGVTARMVAACTGDNAP